MKGCGASNRTLTAENCVITDLSAGPKLLLFAFFTAHLDAICNILVII